MVCEQLFYIALYSISFLTALKQKNYNTVIGNSLPSLHKKQLISMCLFQKHLVWLELG